MNKHILAFIITLGVIFAIALAIAVVLYWPLACFYIVIVIAPCFIFAMLYLLILDSL